jgi:hypothetical protein
MRCCHLLKIYAERLSILTDFAKRARADIGGSVRKIKSTFDELEVGCGRQDSYRLSNRENEVETEPNVLRYVDSHEFSDTMYDAVRFKLVLDTLIDIVERIETYTPQ